MRLLLSQFEQGLSLVELMISLTIGMTLTLGLTILLSNSSSSFKIQDDFARLQENGTAALRYIGDDIRLAGFYGMGITPNKITTEGGLTNPTNDCGGAQPNDTAVNWAFNTANPLISITGLTASNISSAFPCIQAGNFLDHSPILVTRSASGYRIPDPNNDGNLNDATLDSNTVYLQSEPSNGILFKGSDFVNLKNNGITKKRKKYAGDSDPAAINAPVDTNIDFPMYEYQARAYYIRPCSRPSSTTCQGSDDNGAPIPTLVRQELVQLAMRETPIAQGIERINFLYGIDNAPTIEGDGIVDFYTATPSSANWSQIISVKVSVLARTTQPIAGYDDSNKIYNLGTGPLAMYSTNPALASACSDCVLSGINYKRHVFTQTFQVRNVAQRRGA